MDCLESFVRGLEKRLEPLEKLASTVSVTVPKGAAEFCDKAEWVRKVHLDAANRCIKQLKARVVELELES